MKKFIYLFCLLLVGLFFIAPLSYLFLLPRGEDFYLLIQQQTTSKAILNTLMLSLCVSCSCLVIGHPLAWVLTRTNLPFKNKLRSGFSLPYAIPPFVGAIGWIILANPTSGVLNQWLGLNLNIYSFAGLVWVETSFLFSFVLLTAMASLDTIDSSLEECARLSGASELRVFFDIIIPLIKPAILNGFLLTFLATMSSFGIPALIGGPARIYLITTQIYSFQKMGTEQGIKLSIASALLLLLITLVLLLTSHFIISKKNLSTVGGKSNRKSLVDLKKYKWITFIFLLGLFFTIFILPILGIALSAFSNVQGSWSFSNLGFNNFIRVIFETEETARAVKQSILLGFTTATACTLFSFFYNYFYLRTRWFGKNISNVIINIPFSTPGTILALSFILAFSNGYFGFGPSLYNTLTLIFLAYMVKYMSLSHKSVSDGYRQIHPSLEEAAQVSGASWLKIMFTIYLPLLKTPLMASMFLVFMPVISELTMTILLTGPGLETLGTLIFQLQEYSDIGGGGASVLSLLVVLFVVFLNSILKIISQGKYGL